MWRKVFSLVITLSLVLQQVGFASMAAELNLAGHLSKMSTISVDRFRPVHIRFFNFDMLNDNIKVMLDKGDLKSITKGELSQSTQVLLNYFLIGLTLPNDMFWVNLRPDSENEIIDEWLAKTDVGKIMLEADLQLKKDTARFTSPETAEGRAYWTKLYQKAEELYGNAEVTIPTLTRPWIVPNEIIVRETRDSSYIYKATLKVMLEQDVLKGSGMYSFKDERSKALNEYSSQLIREIILPKLTTEVNLSKRYSELRQVFYSLIFSRWFKSRFSGQTGKYASLIDQKELTGITSTSDWSKSSYFDAYKKSFAQGEYNVQETVRTPTGQVIRSYFSGGIDVRNAVLNVAGVSVPDLASSAITKVLTDAGLEAPGTSSPVLGPYEAEFPKIATFAEIGKTIDVEGKVVLFSPDINAPVKSGMISDPNNGRIVETGYSLKQLLDMGAKVVVIFHQGRTGDPAFIENPDQHAEILNKLVGGNRVTSVNDLFGKVAIDAIKGLRSGRAVLLKQVRAKDSSTGKTLEENPWFVPTLRPLIDYFVLGGLSALGGESNRITGFHGVPTMADPLLVREIQDGRNALNPLKPNLSILGGAKIQKTDSVISQLSSNAGADMIIVGGVPAEAALVAAQMEKGKDYSEDELLALATEVLGPSAARSLKVADDGKFFARLPALAKAMQDNPDRIALPKDMAYVEKDTVYSIDLVNGRIPSGFDFVLSGIGPKTDAYYASIINRADNPFQSAEWAGPLIDTRVDALLAYMTETANAISKMSVWSTGGGDTDEAIKKLGFKPPFRSLAGGAGQTFRNRKNVPGIDAAIKNSPEALKGKSFVPATDAEAHALSHTAVFGSLAQAMKTAGGKLVARTGIFNRGQSVGNIKISPVPMNTVIRLTLGDNSDVFEGLETMEIDGQNPWIDFSMTTLRTPMNDRRQISLAATRQILVKDPNIALILLKGEYNKKKDKFGDPGEVKTQSVEETLNAALVKVLRAKGIDPNSVPKAARALPAIAQVTESTIPGQLKIATFVPTPKSDISRLLQLAQDSGVNIKDFLEQSKDINDAGFIAQMEDLKAQPQIALLKEPLPLPVPMQKVEEPEIGANQLEGLVFGDGKINVKTQTIISRGSTGGYAVGDSFIEQLQSIINRVEQTGKLVRIMVPEDSDSQAAIKNMLEALIKSGGKSLTSSMHSVVRGNEKFTAFIIAPQVPYVIVGYGNEAIKVAPTLEVAGFGTPAVAINSLDRIERVMHAFFMGYDIYHADQVLDDKETKKQVFLYDQQPGKLAEFEAKLYKALEDASIVRGRNALLSKLTLSERSNPDKVNEVMLKAKALGEQEAKQRFADQYKGLFSVSLKAGKFKVVIDATPEKIGAQNKKLLYEPVSQLIPDTIFIYQGGEAEGVGFSFSNVSADYNTILLQKHIRHVSCNTTALSTEVISLMQYLGFALSVDNTAIRRVADPGDAKGGVAATQLAFSYHHGPDLILVTPDNLKISMQIPGMMDKQGNQMYYVNTDAAQSGGVTMYHHHILTLTRLDGKPIDVNKVKQVLAARPDVALVDFPQGVFNSVRIVELSHNLLPQAVRNAPDGANHVLVPVVYVKPTDDPSEVILMYAVPQESIVARGQAHIIHAALNMASKDASTEIVQDATGATALVEAIETRLAGDPSYMTLVNDGVAASSSIEVVAELDQPGVKEIAVPDAVKNKQAKIEIVGVLPDGSERPVMTLNGENKLGTIGKDSKPKGVGFKIENGKEGDSIIELYYNLETLVLTMPEGNIGRFVARLAPVALASSAVQINTAVATEILDSRLNPTVKTILNLKNGVTATAEVASGASTGEREALELRDGQRIKDIEAGKRPDLTAEQIVRIGKMLGNAAISKEELYKLLKSRHKGKGVLIAVDNVNNVIAPAIKDFDVTEQRKIDETLIALDGTEFKDNLGANAILSVSMAVARAAARQLNSQLYEYIAKLSGKTPKIPLVQMFNVLNGGEHAGWNLDLQEYMIVPLGFAVGAKTYKERLEIFANVYRALQKILKDKGLGIGVGDEGGFAPKLSSNEEALALITQAIKAAGYQPGADVAFALDPAASQFFKDGKYVLKVDGRNLSPVEMSQYYNNLAKIYPIISIEDGMAEGDEDGWKFTTEDAETWSNEGLAALKKSKGQIVGDDLFVTNTRIFKKGIEKGLANSILIKLNQIGTLTETLDAIKMAEEAGYTTVISHRSGETDDEFIADLVVGTGADQIKTGASRGERTAKHNRIMAIEERMLATAASPMTEGKMAPGGIDFRPAAMPINYQAMGNFASLNLDLPKLSQEELAQFDVDKELAGLETMVERDILPSGERIKEALAAASQKGEMEANRDRMMALLVKVGILEETQCCLKEASQGYKEALVLADSLS